MKVTILGAGSIGLLFASYLSLSGNEVTILTRSQRQKERINQNGVTLIKNNSQQIFPMTAYITKEYIELNKRNHLLIVAVKQIHLKELESTLLKISNQFDHILFVQNGMGHLQMINQLVHPSIILGVVEHGALKADDYIIEHTGIGITRLAAYYGEFPENLFNSLMSENFKIQIEKNWYEMLAKKLVVNAVINPLTTIFKLKNGELLLNQHLSSLMKMLFDEAVAILNLQNTDELWNLVLHVCETTAKNTSSMLRDIHNKQQTEIDAISGYLVGKAIELGKAIPATEFVYHGIKSMEDSFGD